MKKYKLKINEQLYEVTIKNVTTKDIQVEVNGQEHFVEVEAIKNLALSPPVNGSVTDTAPSTAYAPRPPVHRPTASAGGIIAPMPGQIKSIFVREGDRVKAGHKLMIMEAMKLENKIAAKHDGIVKKILVRDGDTVNQGQELIIVE